MFKVGITGNIGSGKTTVSKIFALLGIPIFYADEAAKNIMVTDEVLIAGIKDAFGSDSYFNDRALNRKFIASKVFNDAKQLQKLNSLVHPTVFRAFEIWVNKQQAPYVIKEAAILFESGSYKLCDKSIIVTAPLNIRLDRITARDNITADEAMKREKRQMPQQDKIKLADFVVPNDETRLVIPQVLELHQRFLTLAANK